MKDNRRVISLLTKEEREKAIKDIISYFLDQREEEIGVIAATDVLDFFEQDIAPKIYNKAVEDAKRVFKEELEDLDYKISELRK